MNRRQFLALGAAAPFAASLHAESPTPSGTVHFSAEVPIYGEYDVAVFGAGPAGIGAAVNAARAGKKTILVEKYNFPGGVGAWGSMAIFFVFEDPSPKPTRQVIKGLADEVVRTLDKRGAASLMLNNTCDQPTCERIGDAPLLGKVGFAPEDLRIVYHDLLSSAGVEKLFMANLAGVVRNGRKIDAAIVSCLEGPRAIRAKVYIDATGDAQLVHLAGGATRKAPPLETMHKSMFAELSGVAPHDLAANKRHYRQMFEKGELPEGVWSRMGFMRYREPDHVQLPVAYAVGDCCSSADMTRMDAELRHINEAVLRLYREKLPGYEKAYFVNAATQVSSRDGRHAVGRVTLDRAYLQGDVDAADGVLPIRRRWGLQHSVKQKQGFSAPDTGSKPGHRLLPYGTLVSKDFDNVLMAGRCLSALPDVMGSCRMMTHCMAMGQITGTAASIALDQSLADVGAVPHAELTRRLEACNCVCS